MLTDVWCAVPAATCASADQLLSTKVLRLDFQRIPAIDNLEVFTHVTDLYLQHVRLAPLRTQPAVRAGL